MFRRPERAALIAPLEAEIMCAALESAQSLRRAVTGVDAIIHLAARATFERYAALKPGVVGGTRRLAEAAAEAGVRTFVFGSSTFVYGHHEEPITADTPTDPAIGYGVAKCEAEAALRDIAGQAGMRLGVLRLPHVYGPESMLFTYARGGRLPFAGELDRVFSHLHVADAAQALVAAADGAWAGTAPIGDRQPVSWRTFLAVLKTYYPRLRILRISPAWSLPALRLVELLAYFRQQPTLITPDTVVGWSLRQSVENEEVWRELGIEPRYPSVYVGIPATLDAPMPYRWRHPLLDRA